MQTSTLTKKKVGENFEVTSKVSSLNDVKYIIKKSQVFDDYNLIAQNENISGVISQGGSVSDNIRLAYERHFNRVGLVT